MVGLIGEIGDAHEKASSEFTFDVAGKRHVMHKPHTKDLTSFEVTDALIALAVGKGLGRALRAASSADSVPAEASSARRQPR